MESDPFDMRGVAMFYIVNECLTDQESREIMPGSPLLPSQQRCMKEKFGEDVALRELFMQSTGGSLDVRVWLACGARPYFR